VHCLFARATLGQFVATARSIAELAPASLLEVCRRAWSIRSRALPAYRWLFDLRFLSSEASPIGEQAARHPWLDPPSAALPGKAAHVAMITAAQSVAEGFDAEDDLPTWSTLIAQPVVEACLEAPSWMSFEHGRNPARAARLNRATIRDMLFGGKLRSLGLLDCKALDEPSRSRGESRARFPENHEAVRRRSLGSMLALAGGPCPLASPRSASASRV
jgi:asparagine synthase (glutamine-hydrolysing)